MNKSAILRTAVCKIESDLYVFESPLLPDCIGAAETEEEAWEHFTHHVDVAYASYLEGRLSGMYSRPGRPSKNLASLTLRVKPSTKARLAKLAEETECSQGEFTDYLLAFWEAKRPSVQRKSKTRGSQRKAKRA